MNLFQSTVFCLVVAASAIFGYAIVTAQPGPDYTYPVVWNGTVPTGAYMEIGYGQLPRDYEVLLAVDGSTGNNFTLSFPACRQWYVAARICEAGTVDNCGPWSPEIEAEPLTNGEPCSPYPHVEKFRFGTP